MIPKTRLDYIQLYAARLKEDNSLFKQQKMMIESQMQSSSAILKNMLGSDNDFKENARKYLKQRGLL